MLDIRHTSKCDLRVCLDHDGRHGTCRNKAYFRAHGGNEGCWCEVVHEVNGLESRVGVVAGLAERQRTSRRRRLCKERGVACRQPKLVAATSTPQKICSPSSFPVTASSMTFSPNLYVSQHATTGILLSFASMATNAVPAREYSEPSESSAAVPKRTRSARFMTEGREGKRQYEVGILEAARTLSSVRPEA